MDQYSNLKMQALAIGSLPHTNLEEAMSLVKKDFSEIPFFPQLANISKNEDMIIQVLEGMPSFFSSKKYEKFEIDSESDEFFESLEEFFCDYEEVISDINSDILEKYAISKDFSSSFPIFEQFVKEMKPSYAKGQIVGPFTLSSSLNDVGGKSLLYDETLRDVVVKLLSLKVLWQIRRIKQANSSTIPIIFIDEPSISQLGTSAYLTISEDEVVDMIKEISDLIQSNGGISAIHCCGKCDWSIPIRAGVNIINFDAYAFSEHFGLYNKEIENFLKKGGKIAWGIVPTLDSEALELCDLGNLFEKFEKSLKYLTNKGIDEKLIRENSLVTSSCGAGSLTVELATKAMDLVSKLSLELRKRI